MDAHDDQQEGRGGWPPPPAIDPAVLRKYFSLDDSDLAATERSRGASNRLGFAVQLCWLRWRGEFLDEADLPTLPAAAPAALAAQLGLLMVDGLLTDYPGDPKTGPEHRERIREHLGFTRCDGAQRARLLDFLRGETLRLPPRAVVLQESAARWLREQKIVRPGRTTLRELVGTARESALETLYQRLAGNLDAGQREGLDALLAVGPDPKAGDPTVPPPRSALEGFKVVPRRESPAALLELTRRLADLDALGLSASAAAALAEVHPATRARLAAWGWRYDAWSLRRFAPAKRYAIVLAFLAAARAEATDALVKMQDKLITRVHHQAKRRRETLLRQSEEARGRAVTVLGELGAMIADESIADGDLRARVLARWPPGELAALAGDCRDLGRVAGVGDGSHLGLLTHWHAYCRQYVGRQSGFAPIYHHTLAVFSQDNAFNVDIPATAVILSRDGDLAKSYAALRAVLLLGSAAEHACIEINYPDKSAVSTVRYVALNNAAGKKTYFATLDNYQAIYDDPDFQAGWGSYYADNVFPNFLYSNYPQQLVIPQDGNQHTDQLTGNGYFAFSQSSVSALISNPDYTAKGGHSTTTGQVDPNQNPRPTNPNGQGPENQDNPQTNEPIDLLTGAYVMDHADLTLGGEDARGLALTRSYSSDASGVGGELGPGWNHSYRTSLAEHTDLGAAYGRTTPAAAATMIAVGQALADLMRNDAGNAKGWVVASIAADWATAQLRNNTVSVVAGLFCPS